MFGQPHHTSTGSRAGMRGRHAGPRFGTGARRRPGALVLALFAALALAFGGIAGTSQTAAAADPPVLTAIRAAHNPGFDRVVFEFNTKYAPKATVKWVTTLIEDASGRTIPYAGRAAVQVVMTGANAHRADGTASVTRAKVAYALPNVIQVIPAGDFEAVITYGISVTKQTTTWVTRLTNPGRVVVDIDTNFPRVTKKVYFVDTERFADGTEPYVRAVSREVPSAAPATGTLDRMFGGPTPNEKATDLKFVASKATGFAALSISNNVLHVRLTGGCDSGGSTLTIASELMPTARQYARWVKIYYPAHVTERPTGQVDSIPECLEP